MANDWRAVSLGELFRVKHGFAFKSEYFTDEPQDTVLVTPGNFAIGGGFQDGKRKYYNGQLPEDYVLKPGQVVVTMTDLSKESDTLGYAASIPNDSTVWLHNQRVGLLEFKTEIPTSPRFIEYLLRTHEYRSWIVGSATGTTVKHTAPGRIENFATRIPPIEEQHAIAHILGTLDDKIELNRRRNETLEAMARALFKAWFVDFEPVRAKLEGRWQRGQSLPGLPAHLYDIFPDRIVESELGEIPEGWEMTSLSEFSSLNPDSWTKKTRPEEIRYVDLSNTKWGRVESVTNYEADDAPSRAQRVLRPMDTIVGTVRPGNGSYALVADEGLTGSTGFAVLRPLRRECSEFVYLASTACENIDRLSNLANGGAYPAVRPEIVSSTQVPRIGQELLHAFSGQVSPMLAGMADNERTSRTLAQLRDTLLPKLISGELRVPDVEAFLRERGL
ncbi:type I restriction enzyme, S subunit [Nitrosomonas eutropha]|uniref:restriction endonuclease subunit S n=1 Tax=Nitrosomonas eutropha TaxID=916 RepID=UPI0008908680|nr:restriction endonuclease subunit S [Nitrosomonas eutropha]SCX03515.1 type I restriction enzyme, S subunit [Nitrosomonas eutropha]